MSKYCVNLVTYQNLKAKHNDFHLLMHLDYIDDGFVLCPTLYIPEYLKQLAVNYAEWNVKTNKEKSSIIFNYTLLSFFSFFLFYFLVFSFSVFEK